jgi:Arc/MetJ-type ribon-helix-helix transcriptional regulator
MFTMSMVTKISFPKDFAHQIQKLIDDQGLPYRSVSEFVLDSSRRRFEELQEKKLLEVKARA